jgi:Flp pilus assembly protein TadD
LNQDLPEFHNQRGIIFTQKGDPQSAIQELMIAIQTQPKASYWNNLGIAYQNSRNAKEAESAYQKALSLNPEYEECEANLAFLLIQLKRWEDAQTHLARVTSKNTKMFRARFALGYVLENLNKKQEALDVYQKLLADAPHDWPQKQQVQSRIQALSQ